MIRWNTEVHAPCCPGEIINLTDGRSILIQVDWDYPSVATSFGWNMTEVQRCNRCGALNKVPRNDCRVDVYICKTCNKEADICDHSSTDGTIDCDCGVTASEFIAIAGDWLRQHDGVEVEDPGYFV